MTVKHNSISPLNDNWLPSASVKVRSIIEEPREKPAPAIAVILLSSIDCAFSRVPGGRLAMTSGGILTATLFVPVSSAIASVWLPPLESRDKRILSPLGKAMDVCAPATADVRTLVELWEFSEGPGEADGLTLGDELADGTGGARRLGIRGVADAVPSGRRTTVSDADRLVDTSEEIDIDKLEEGVIRELSEAVPLRVRLGVGERLALAEKEKLPLLRLDVGLELDVKRRLMEGDVVNEALELGVLLSLVLKLKLEELTLKLTLWLSLEFALREGLRVGDSVCVPLAEELELLEVEGSKLTEADGDTVVVGLAD